MTMYRYERTDGTVAATVPVRTFSPASSYDTPEPQLTVLDGALFFVALDSEHGGELWLLLPKQGAHKPLVFPGPVVSHHAAQHGCAADAQHPQIG